MRRFIAWLVGFFNPKGIPPPTRGVPIELDKTRYLRYPLRVMHEIRQEFGKKALEEGVITEHL
ncbi:hypothetical protein LCGC14_2562800, partial [marine sediment metagenome]